jgi:hypothetical protein
MTAFPLGTLPDRKVRGEKNYPFPGGPKRSQADRKRSATEPDSPCKLELARDPGLLKMRRQASPSPGGEGREEGERHSTFNH